jgi:hypothetical protein
VAEWVRSLGSSYGDTAVQFEQAGIDGSGLHELYLQHAQRDDSIASSTELRNVLPARVGERLHLFHALRALVGEGIEKGSESLGEGSPSPPPPAKLNALMSRIREGLDRQRSRQTKTRRSGMNAAGDSQPDASGIKGSIGGVSFGVPGPAMAGSASPVGGLEYTAIKTEATDPMTPLIASMKV